MLTNAEMKEGRYLRWHQARQRIAWIKEHLAAGRTVQLTTCTKATRYKAKHADYFKATRMTTMMRGTTGGIAKLAASRQCAIASNSSRSKADTSHSSPAHGALLRVPASDLTKEGNHMQVNSWDICVQGFERLRTNDEFLLPIPVNNQTTIEDILSSLADEIQCCDRGDDFDYLACDATLAQWAADNRNDILRAITSLDDEPEDESECDYAGCYLFVYMQA